MTYKQCHVVMFPWFAFGHMIPFLELAKKLAENGIKISFISTPRNLQRLPPIPLNLADEIKMVEIPLPSVDGLPEDCEATVDLQPEQNQYLKKASDKLLAPFENILQNDLPDLILIDFLSNWTIEMAAKLRVPTAYFSVYTAATLAYLGPPDELKSNSRRRSPEHFTVAPDWFTFPSLVAHRPDYAPAMLRNTHTPDKSGLSSGQRLGAVIEGCNFVAIRSCREFEGEYIDLLEQLYQKPVLPIGVLPPQKTPNAIDSNWFSTFEWLDKQKHKSVVFVGFGSEYKMPIEQVHELAFGLELSKLPFVWILRKPKGIDDHTSLLPPGFESRTSDRGKVCLRWAPQLEILAHPAIGGCLFHSGWGSIIESLGFGHPLILMPMVADQGLNAKLLVEKGVGYEVARSEDGSFNRDMVANSMRLVMEDPEGEPVRVKASQMKTFFGNQDIQENYIKRFIRHLVSLRERSTGYQEKVFPTNDIK